MDLATMLSQNMGAKLQEDKLGTKKNKTDTTTQNLIPKNQHQLVFTFEKRRGKPVTLVGRFYISNEEKKEVLKLLKKKLASGGTINDEWIEIQGNVKDKIKEILTKDGWKFK